MTENNTVYQARLHLIIFLWPILALCCVAFIAMKFSQLQIPAYISGGCALVWLLITWLTYLCTSLVIKKSQVVLYTGILIRQTLDVPITKIESIDIRQSILGSLLHYGCLVITGTGGSRQLVNYLNKPLTCRRYIEQLLHKD